MGCPFKKLPDISCLKRMHVMGPVLHDIQKPRPPGTFPRKQCSSCSCEEGTWLIKRSSNIWIWTSWFTITHEIINCSFSWTHKKDLKSRRKQADHEFLEEGNPKWWLIHSMQQKKWDPWCYSCSFAAESNLSLQKRFMIVVTYMEGKL